MNEPPLRRKNHFVPRVYLKRFATASGEVWTYRTLVSANTVPRWQAKAISTIARQHDLYTRSTAEGESDELERWLDQEFEAPAEESLRRATSGERLSPTDWEHLVRFFAAQDVRTPARYVEEQLRWEKMMPDLLDEVLQDSIRDLEVAVETGQCLVPDVELGAARLPARVTRVDQPGEEQAKLKLEILSGRALWQYGIRYLLTETVSGLCQHRWTVLSPPAGGSWFTSDDPVIRLNFNSPTDYDLKGGWGSPGTDLMLPLSPHHLLYTQIGHRPPARGEKVSPTLLALTRRFIAEHADRMIFASAPDPEVPTLRPRVVDAVAYRSEEQQWRSWHQDQTAAERELMKDKDPQV